MENVEMAPSEEALAVIRSTVPARAGVREYGEEVTFYRRLPVAGVENPDDVRKIEFVPWREAEANQTPSTANEAPLGQGIPRCAPGSGCSPGAAT